MAEFIEAHKVIGGNEGGYAPARGKAGETYCGIDRKWHPKWRGWPIVDNNKPLKKGEIIKDNTLSYMVKSFFKTNFWDAIKGDFITSQRIATFIYDWLVTSWDDAIKAAQQVAGVPQDGKFGPRTLSALNKLEDEDGAIKRLKAIRIAYYKSLKDPVNQKGWIARVNRF